MTTDTTDTVLQAAKPDREALYGIYKALRHGDIHSSARKGYLPRGVNEIKHELDRYRDGSEEKYEARKKALDLDFDYASNIKPYGGYVSDITLDADAVRALGFDPEHLTAKVTASYDDFFETAEQEAKNMGFVVEKDGGEWYRNEDENRPTHESVKVDYSGPRDRSNYVWVTENDPSNWLGGNAYKGMSKGVAAETRHFVLLAAAQNMADYMHKWSNDDIKNFNIEVAVYWRDEEVGSASLGGCEVEEKFGREQADDFADMIVGNGLLDEALDEAAKWADGAVDDAKREAAKLVEDIALLPQRSIDAVRNAYTTATVIAAKKHA